MSECIVVVDVQLGFLDNSFYESSNDRECYKSKLHGERGKEKDKKFVDDLVDFLRHKEDVYYTKDYHPRDHYSFGIWDPHCIIGTIDCEFPKEFDALKNKKVYMKGFNNSWNDGMDYSGGNAYKLDNNMIDKITFDKRKEFENLRLTTELSKYSVINIVGIAFDYCVWNTARDIKKIFPDKVVKILKKHTISINENWNPEEMYGIIVEAF